MMNYSTIPIDGKPTLQLSRGGARSRSTQPVVVVPSSSTTVNARKTSIIQQIHHPTTTTIMRQLPIPSSFVDDLLYRLQKDDDDSNDDDDDNDSNDDDGNIRNHNSTENDIPRNSGTTGSCTSHHNSSKDDPTNNSKNDLNTTTTSSSSSSSTIQQRHIMDEDHTTHTRHRNNSDTNINSDTKETKKALLRQQLQQCKVELLLQQPQQPPSVTTTTITTAVVGDNNHYDELCELHLKNDPSTTNTSTTLVLPTKSEEPKPKPEPLPFTTEMLLTMVDEVFYNCLQPPPPPNHTTTNDSNHRDIATTTTENSTSAASSFLTTCTIQEFYTLVQTHINEHHHHHTKTTTNPRVRRTIVLKKEMKVRIKERLQYLIQQPKQQQENQNQSLPPPPLLAPPLHQIIPTSKTTQMPSSNTHSATTATSVDTVQDSQGREVDRSLLLQPPLPKQQHHKLQQVETAASTKITREPLKVKSTINEKKSISNANKNKKNQDNNGNESQNAISRGNTEMADHVETMPSAAPLPLPLPPKGRRARLPKPSKKTLSLAEECTMIVESVKKRSNLPPPPVSENNNTDTPMIGTTTSVVAPTRKRKMTCPLCTKCPCQFKNHASDDAADDLGTAKSKKGKLDINSFCQSDTATEKMLLQKLHKLEITTDQYDEQTEAIRRLLKKHRRQMYQKRQAMLQKYDQQYGQGSKNNQSSRFLPDVDEIQYQNTNASIPKPPMGDVPAIKASMFGKGKTMTTHTTLSHFQPTLTQMIGSTIHTDDTNQNDLVDLSSPGCNKDNHDDVTEMRIPTNDDPHHHHHDDDDDDEHRDDIGPMVIVNHTTPPPAHRIQSSSTFFESPKPPPVTSKCVSSPMVAKYHCNDDDIHHHANGGSSIWDSFRYGIYDSSWDNWFSHTTETSVDENIAVNHLLQLLPSSPDAVAMKSSSTAPPTPPSHLSRRAEALVDDVVQKVYSNPLQLSAIEHINPNWKENIRYAMGQRDEPTIQDALWNVRTVRDKLRSIKEQIMANVDRQETVLNLYEETLLKANSRLGGSVLSQAAVEPPTDEVVVSDDTIPPTQGFFLSQQHNTSTNLNHSRHSDELMVSSLPATHEQLFDTIDDGVVPRFDRNNNIENDITTIFYSHDDDEDSVDQEL